MDWDRTGIKMKGIERAAGIHTNIGRTTDWRSREGKKFSKVAKEMRMMREGQRKEEDDWGKEIVRELREMCQEILKEIKREGEKLKQEMREIRRQLEGAEKRQEAGCQSKEGGGRAEAERKRGERSDEETEMVEERKNEEKERKEESSRGGTVNGSPKHEGEKCVERG